MSLAAFPAMMRRDRRRLRLRECRAAWLLGLTVREYRQLEAGEDRALNADVWERMVEVFGWPVSYWPPANRGSFLNPRLATRQRDTRSPK